LGSVASAAWTVRLGHRYQEGRVSRQRFAERRATVYVELGEVVGQAWDELIKAISHRQSGGCVCALPNLWSRIAPQVRVYGTEAVWAAYCEWRHAAGAAFNAVAAGHGSVDSGVGHMVAMPPHDLELRKAGNALLDAIRADVHATALHCPI